MTLQEAMQQRHSVRQYRDVPIENDLIERMQEEIDACNQEGDLHIQLVLNEPRAFGGSLAKYGNFRGVSNYIALVGKKSHDLNERCGYYGERLVLLAQQLGLHTCWVAATYKKIPDAFTVEKNEKVTAVISLGYGVNCGLSRHSKSARDVSNISDYTPEWFKNGVTAALLAPTAMNQQNFFFSYRDDGTVTARAGIGVYTGMDLGIVKYHFEIGAGVENFKWTPKKKEKTEE